MIWKEIEGYKFRYRISEEAEFQKFDPDNGWVTIRPVFCWGRSHVRVRPIHGGQIKIAVVNLMDKYFFNGYAKKNGLKIYHKNGSKTDCSAKNLEFLTQSQIGKICGKNGSRKPIIKSKNGIDLEAYSSVTEAAKKNNLTVSSLKRRMKGQVLDEKGRQFRYE